MVKQYVLCGQFSSVHLCGLSPSSSPDGVVSTTITLDCRSWVFLHLLVMSHSSVSSTYDTWVWCIWSLRDGHARAIHVLEEVEV